MPKFTHETAAAHGRAGGTATCARHGRAHMRRIGRHGAPDWFQLQTERAWAQGCASAAAARRPSLADCDTSMCDIPF